MKKRNAKLREIDVTDEYDVFERLPGNRTVDEGHVIRLMNSMKEKDLFVPIIINTNFQVIDGQHRLEARKRLKLPVPYVVSGNYGLEDVQSLNSKQKSWTITDFAKSFVELGKKDYEIYLWFRKQYDLPHGSAMALLTDTPVTIGGGGRHNFREIFENGALKVKNLAKAKAQAEDILKLQPHFDHWNSRNFINALMFCWRKKAFAFDKFMERVVANPTMLKACANTEMYVSMIEDLYNFRSKNKVSLRYGEDK